MMPGRIVVQPGLVNCRCSWPLVPSPGFNDLNWFRPVFVDDTIAYETTVMGKRLSTREGWGFVTSRVQGHNQHGVKVFESLGASMIPRLPGQ